MKKNGMNKIETENTTTNEQTNNTSPLSSRDHTENEVVEGTLGAVLSPLCRSDCKICNFEHAQDIHDMLSAGEKYLDICDYLKREYDFSISPASITRHMQNYNRNRNATINRKFLKKMSEINDDLAKNKAQAAYLGSLVFQQILERIEVGSITFDISDWEKIMKLQHGILNGDAGAGDDLMVIFAKASKKMGVPLHQSPLPLE